MSINWKMALKVCLKYSSILFFIIALYFVYRQVDKIGTDNVLHSIFSIPEANISWGIIFVAIGYLALSLYDFLALKYVNRKMSLLRVMAASMCGFAVSNNVGHAYISGASVRYDFYSSWGLTGGDILKMIGFSTLTYVLGVGLLLDFSLIFSPAENVSALYLYGSGAVITLAFLAYWFFIIVPKRTLKFKKVVLPAPSQKMTLLQFMLGAMDMMLVAMVCYMVMRTSLPLSFLHFLSLFMIAQFIGLSTQVPGGIGVFEALFLGLLPENIGDQSNILASLIVFRILYYFIPLAVAGVCMLMYHIGPVRQLIFGKDNPATDKEGHEVL